MRDRHLTLLIVPEDESNVRRIRLSYRTLRWLGILGGAFGVAVLVGLGTCGSLVGRTGRLALLERENRRLQAERAQLGNIVENLERSERTYQQIKSLAGLEDLPSAAAATAVPVADDGSLPEPALEAPPGERPAPEPIRASEGAREEPRPGPAKGRGRPVPDEVPAEELAIPSPPRSPGRGSGDAGSAPSGWPLAVEGFVTARFEGPDGHTGVDIAVPRETPVLATAPGRVSEVGFDAVLGHYVVVAHDGGVETLYAHNSRILVEPGERVARLEAVAHSGNSGRSTAPHLHYEIRRGGRLVDPDSYLH